jgi:hypothetical protein
VRRLVGRRKAQASESKEFKIKVALSLLVRPLRIFTQNSRAQSIMSTQLKSEATPQATSIKASMKTVFFQDDLCAIGIEFASAQLRLTSLVVASR